MSLGIGLGAIFFPVMSSIMYGAPTQDRGFVQAAGVRDLFIAIMIFAAWQEQATKLLFLSVLALGLVSLGDAFVTWFSGNRKRSPLHFAAGIVVLAYSIYMLS